MLTLDDFDLRPPCRDETNGFDETQMGDDAMNFVDLAMICRYGYDIASYSYPSELEAVMDLEVSNYLKNLAAEDNDLSRVASYVFPISEQVDSIMIVSAVV